MNLNNPYKTKKKATSKAPVLLRVPMYEFSNPKAVEEELQPEELCIAKTPNSNDTGYTHHVGLVYKNLEGDVFSLTMAQHHGELKEGSIEAITKEPQKKANNFDFNSHKKKRKNGKKSRKFKK